VPGASTTAVLAYKELEFLITPVARRFWRSGNQVAHKGEPHLRDIRRFSRPRLHLTGADRQTAIHPKTNHHRRTTCGSSSAITRALSEGSASG
jgi:hypothetical protein